MAPSGVPSLSCSCLVINWFEVLLVNSLIPNMVKLEDPVLMEILKARGCPVASINREGVLFLEIAPPMLE